MLKDEYKKPYFNRRNWILDKYNELNLTSDECMILLLIDFGKEYKMKVNYEFLQSKLKYDTKKIDKILAGLVSKGYLAINTNAKGIFFDIDGLFMDDPEKYELVKSDSVYEYLAELINRPLTSNELQKTSDLIKNYNEKSVFNAIRIAEGKGKKSIAYVEGILRNEKKS